MSQKPTSGQLHGSLAHKPPMRSSARPSDNSGCPSYRQNRLLVLGPQECTHFTCNRIRLATQVW
jgi:hypothetical protein